MCRITWWTLLNNTFQDKLYVYVLHYPCIITTRQSLKDKQAWMTWLERQGCLCPHTSCVTYRVDLFLQIRQCGAPSFTKNDSNMAESILDFSKDLDVQVLDRVVMTFFTGSGSEVRFSLSVLYSSNAHQWPCLGSFPPFSNNSHSNCWPSSKIMKRRGLESTAFSNVPTYRKQRWVQTIHFYNTQHTPMQPMDTPFTTTRPYAFFPTMPTNTTRILSSSLLHFRFLRNSCRPDGTLLSLKAEMVIRVVLDTMIYTDRHVSSC